MNAIYEYYKLNNLIPYVPHMANKITQEMSIIFTDKQIELYFDVTANDYKLAHMVYGGEELDIKNKNDKTDKINKNDKTDKTNKFDQTNKINKMNKTNKILVL